MTGILVPFGFQVSTMPFGLLRLRYIRLGNDATDSRARSVEFLEASVVML
jgi:hypothetical protein